MAFACFFFLFPFIISIFISVICDFSFSFHIIFIRTHQRGVRERPGGVQLIVGEKPPHLSLLPLLEARSLHSRGGTAWD